jgi:hypothetical protein
VLPAIGLAVLLTFAAQPSRAGQASALFRVTVDLLTGTTPPGVACRNSTGAASLECSPRPVVAGATNSDTRVILYGSSLIEEDGRMWGAVAASRRVTWAGREYLELTLSW